MQDASFEKIASFMSNCVVCVKNETGSFQHIGAVSVDEAECR